MTVSTLVQQVLAAMVILLLGVNTTVALAGSDSSIPEACTPQRSACVQVVAETVSTPNLRRGFRWGGEDDEPPARLLVRLNVSSQGNPVFVPLSAFADLGDPKKVEIRSAGPGNFTVRLHGGDAASAYVALWTFSKSTLVRRRVHHAEFPDHAWEVTKYRFNTRSN